MTDWGQVYVDGLDAVEPLVRGLGPEELTRGVPATPEWNAQQVLAHLAGTTSDQMSGRTEGAPGPAWTANHVAERADVSIDELIAELRSTPANPADFAAVAPAAVWNLSVHLADLHEAFGLPQPPPSTWAPIVDELRDRIPPALADADDYELFRVLFSRRSRAQVAALSTDPSADLDGVSLFGPRDDDQPLAAG